MVNAILLIKQLAFFKKLPHCDSRTSTQGSTPPPSLWHLYLNLRLRALKTWQEFQVKAAQYNPIMYIIYHISSIYLSICLSVRPSVRRSVGLSVCRSVCLSVGLSICTYTHIYAHIRTYTYTILYVHIPWICSCKKACIRTLTEWQFKVTEGGTFRMSRRGAGGSPKACKKYLSVDD